jgi:GMP synthase (glutamine-hydrolysing)
VKQEKLRLVLLNNYSNTEKTEVTLRSLAKSTGQKIELVDYRTPNLYEKIVNKVPDLLFLSGSSHMLTRPENQRNFEPETRIIRDAEFPILGICYGHQLIGRTFGAKLSDLGRMCSGFERVKILQDHPLFDDLPNEIRVPESHRQALANVPTGFDCLGESASSKVEIMVHKSRPVYGFQFHPERADEEHQDGRVLIQNILRLAVKA